MPACKDHYRASFVGLYRVLCHIQDLTDRHEFDVFSQKQFENVCGSLARFVEFLICDWPNPVCVKSHNSDFLAVFVGCHAVWNISSTLTFSAHHFLVTPLLKPCFSSIWSQMSSSKLDSTV